MRILPGVFIGTLFALLAACSHEAIPIRPITTSMAILKTTIGGLNLEDPETDAKKNVAHGDFRFICVCGFACLTPGIPQASESPPEKYGRRCLEGTTDFVEGNEHQELIEKVTKYAEVYNQALLKELQQESP